MIQTGTPQAELRSPRKSQKTNLVHVLDVLSNTFAELTNVMLLFLQIAVISLSAVIVYLLMEIRKLEIYGALGVPNRQALDRRRFKLFKRSNYAAFIDIDNMHKANEMYGYEVVNQKLRNSFQVLRNTEWRIFQYFGGDEFVIICPKNEIIQPIARLVDALAKEGLTATIAVGEVSKLESLKSAVQDQKLAGKRNTVSMI